MTIETRVSADGLNFNQFGKRYRKVDGDEKVTGRAVFGADFTAPGSLFAKIVRSPHAHARILSIDTSEAEAMPGVETVCTAADSLDSAVTIQVGDINIHARAPALSTPFHCNT